MISFRVYVIWNNLPFVISFLVKLEIDFKIAPSSICQMSLCRKVVENHSSTLLGQIYDTMKKFRDWKLPELGRNVGWIFQMNFLPVFIYLLKLKRIEYGMHQSKKTLHF